MSHHLGTSRVQRYGIHSEGDRSHRRPRGITHLGGRGSMSMARAHSTRTAHGEVERHGWSSQTNTRIELLTHKPTFL